MNRDKLWFIDNKFVNADLKKSGLSFEKKTAS